MKKFLLGMSMALGLLVMNPGSVFADAAIPVTTDSNSIAQIKLAPMFVTLLISLVLPLINGFLTKLSDSGGVKTMLLIALSAVNSFVLAAVMEGGYYVFTKETISTFIVTTAIAMAASSGLYKPIGLTSSAVALPDPNHPGQVVYVPGKLANVGRQ